MGVHAIDTGPAQMVGYPDWSDAFRQCAQLAQVAPIELRDAADRQRDAVHHDWTAGGNNGQNVRLSMKFSLMISNQSTPPVARRVKTAVTIISCGSSPGRSVSGSPRLKPPDSIYDFGA